MKNIGLNKLHDKITIVAHAVTDKTCVGNMELSSEEAGVHSILLLKLMNFRQAVMKRQI